MDSKSDRGSSLGATERTDAFLLALPLGLLLIAIWAALQLLSLADSSFHSRGEPREAIAVQDVVGSGRYVLPLRNGYETPRKPPLFYWLGGLVAGVRGEVDEATVRAPSALQSGAAALMLLAVGATAGSPLAGFLSALALLTSFEWLRAAVSARIDMTLAFGTTASFVGLYLSRVRPGGLALALLYGGMIWGTLAKGPVGIVLPTLAAMVVLLLESGIRTIYPLLGLIAVSALSVQLGAPAPVVIAVTGVAFLVYFAYVAWETARPLHPIAGYSVVGVATTTWYLLAARAGGDAFVAIVLAENFGRFLGTAAISVGHQHGFGYLVGALAAGALPWTLFVLCVVRPLLRRRPPAARMLITHAAVWLTVVFGFFSLSDSKRSVYLLPLYPALACLLGYWLEDIWSDRRQPRLLWWLAQGLALALTLVGAVVAVAFGLDLLGIDVRGAIVAPILLEAIGPIEAAALGEGFTTQAARIASLSTLLVAAAGALLFCSMKRLPRGAVVALFATVLALEILAQRAVMPAVSVASDRRPFADRVVALAGERPIVTERSFDAAVAFHLGGAVPVVDFLRTHPPTDALTVIDPKRWRALPARERRRYEPVPGIYAPKQNGQIRQMVIQRAPDRTTKDKGEPTPPPPKN